MSLDADMKQKLDECDVILQKLGDSDFKNVTAETQVRNTILLY